MSQSSPWNIVQALSAFKSQRCRHASREQALRQLKCFPPHLMADCQREMELTLLAASAAQSKYVWPKPL